MNDISDVTGKGLPTSSALLKASAVAAVIAAVLLVLFILPAEYGVDPTSIGSRLGLTAMSNGGGEQQATLTPSNDAASDAASPISSLDAVWKSETPFRSDEMAVTLAPDEGVEIKAIMRVGERFVFSWNSDGPVNFDMHGEEPYAGKGEFTSYWKGRGGQAASGAFQAPFSGTHGWYWRNRGTNPVTVRIQAAGYYEKLFRP